MRRPGGSASSESTSRVSGRDPAPAAALLLVAGEGFFSTHELVGGALVIGRGAGCDVVIDHRALSRRHAMVVPGPPVTVHDLDSTNGTLIAGALRRGGAALELAAGDSFHIGPFSFVLIARGAADDRSRPGRDVLRVDDPTPREAPALMKDIAASPASILVLGETGVGKEVLAETLHRLSGRAGALVRINCAALSETLLESELFGHEKGAFTGAVAQKAGLLEAADGGTVFLDEVGELPPPMQAKLLRAVEGREVVRLGSTRPSPIDVRFVAATHRDLPAEVAAGAFRRDLYFRLDGVTFVIPPLRERRGMIGSLALRFLAAARPSTAAPPRLAAEVLAALEAHAWPGNVRELKAVIDRAVLLAQGGEIGVRHLAFAPPTDRGAAAPSIRMAAAPASLEVLGDAARADRAGVLAALDACAGNQTRAARMLGISRTTLVTKIRVYRIPRPRV